MKTMEEILDKIRQYGWTVEEEENSCLLAQFTPCGLDFYITIDKSDDVNGFVRNIYDAYKDYDVSKEVKCWTDESGHGIKGAPYEIEDLVKDIKWCKEELYSLWFALSENKKETETIDYKRLAGRYLNIAYNAIIFAKLDQLYSKDKLLKELGCTEEEYDNIMSGLKF